MFFYEMTQSVRLIASRLLKQESITCWVAIKYHL